MKKLLFIFAIALSIPCSAQYIGYGYLLGIDDERPRIEIIKTQSPDTVRSYIELHTGARIVPENLNCENQYIEINTAMYAAYIQIQAVYQKKNGKLKYRKLNEKRDGKIREYGSK